MTLEWLVGLSVHSPPGPASVPWFTGKVVCFLAGIIPICSIWANLSLTQANLFLQGKGEVGMERPLKGICGSVNFARSVFYCLERPGSGYQVRLTNSKADGPAYTAAFWPEVGGGSRWESYACAMCVCIGGERISRLTTFLGFYAELMAREVRKLLGWFCALNFRKP